jgi:heme/copper-type cytochrome/quinol oxidase subunit 2
MSAALAGFVADAAEEGRNVILSMLVVGLVFLAVIALGELNNWRIRRRKRARY